MSKPRLLDLYCGAGGSARGYQLAGFHVTGIDNQPMPRYAGDVFIQADALEFVRAHGHEFDAIHASPPCQAHSAMRQLRWQGAEHPDLIAPTRDALIATGPPFVIENVPRAPLLNGITLCGAMFGLRVYRHRRFESNLLLLAPPHPTHREPIGKAGDTGGGNLARYNPANGMVSVVGHQYPTEMGKRAMQISWMSRDELSQALPPAYCEFVGRQLLAVVRANREAAVA